MPVLNVAKKMVISLLILLFSFILFYYGSIFLQPAGELLDNKVEKIIHIKPGSTIDEISNQLSKDDIIIDPLVFEVYVRFKGVASQVKAGHYRLSSMMTLSQIVDKLVAGEMADYKLTIPEGATIENIAYRLEKKGIKREKFLKLAKTSELNFLDLNVQAEEDILYQLEGFLFPNTYRIPYGSSAKEVIKIMLRQFQEQIKSLESKIKESEYYVQEIITIASLIQAEGQLENEFPVISSVIHNRLDRGMKLQIDATIQYILPQRKARLLYSDLKVDSPYNTYLNYGLPPGPINNPGIKAVKAALQPADTDYLYYVAVGGGEHKFSKTYREHLRIQNNLDDSSK